jgi:hypothetical protein
VMMVDLHGHSRRMNVFMYGCHNSRNPVYRLRERVFPLAPPLPLTFPLPPLSLTSSPPSLNSSPPPLLIPTSRANPLPNLTPPPPPSRILSNSSPWFNYDLCDFRVQRCKESTARVVVHREFHIINSFTLEASFCGPDYGPYAASHFSTQQLEEVVALGGWGGGGMKGDRVVV